MNHLPETSEETSCYVQEHNLVHTDLRYSFAKQGSVADVIAIDDTHDNEDSYRRLLIVSYDEEDISTEVWSTADSMDELYVTPRIIDELPSGSIVYQIPTSARPFAHESSFSEKARNDISDGSVAKSLGRLVASHYKRTGTLVSADTARERLMIIDFQGSNVEPIMLAPPLLASTQAQTLQSAYTSVFSDDFEAKTELNKIFEKLGGPGESSRKS